MWKRRPVSSVFGWILWFVFTSPVAANESTSSFAVSSFDTAIHRATLALERHVVVRSYIEDAALSEARRLGAPAWDMVQRRLGEHDRAFAVAWNGAGQACSVILGPSAGARFVVGGWIHDEAATFLRALEPHIRDLADDDCWIEVSSLLDPGSPTGDMAAALQIPLFLADFIRQSPVDGREEGVLIFDRGSGPRIHRISYMKHASADDFPAPRRARAGLAELVPRLAEGDDLLALDDVGFVIRGAEGVSIATYLDPLGEPPRHAKLCTKSELARRYGKTGGASRELLELDDRHIAARALPGLWHEPTHLEVAAYVLCP